MKKLVVALMMAAMVTGLTACGGDTPAESAQTESVQTDTADAGQTGTEGTVAEAEPAEDTGSSFAGSEITVVSREDGSGTRGAFIELFGIEEKGEDGSKTDHTTEEAVIANKTDVMLTSVAGDESAIGYVSLGSLSDSVKALKIDGVAPGVETIKDGSYAIARPFHIATKGEPSEAAADFISFMLSAEGQKIVEDNGYIANVESPEAYAGGAESGKVVVAGSSSVSPVMEKLKEAYVVLNPGVEIEVQQNDSTTGMQSAIDGTCDIGMASRELKDTELAELTPTAIALDGIAVIVNNANPAEDMSITQVKDIFTGETTEWE